MDYKELAKQFIEDGAWDGVPAIAVRLFAQWLEEHEAAEQGVHPTLLTPRPETVATKQNILAALEAIKQSQSG